MRRHRARQPLSRRRFLSLIAGAVLAAITAGATAARDVGTLDTYYWRRTGETRCWHGTLEEKWCYVRCSQMECETLWCEWRPVGRC